MNQYFIGECDDCLQIKPVKRTFCPFREVVYEEEILIQVCSECYEERADEI